MSCYRFVFRQQVSMIREFNGDLEKLGNAERFYWELIKVPHYLVRLQGMIQVRRLCFFFFLWVGICACECVK